MTRKQKTVKSYLPIGIVPFRTRCHIAKELVRVAIGVLLGDEWTNNIATDKDVKISMTLKKAGLSEKP